MLRSKKNQSNENLLRKSMNRRSTLNGYIKYYEDLLVTGKIQPTGGAYKRLIQLREKYVSTY